MNGRTRPAARRVLRLSSVLLLCAALLAFAAGALAESYSDVPSGFVSLGDAVPDAILEIRYYSTFNFVGERIDGYEEPAALLTREAAEALEKASDELVGYGFRLKVWDAYRPQQAVDHFVRWASDEKDVRMKAYFYPDLNKGSIIRKGYVAKRSGHSRGSTVDVTLFDMAAGRDADMGGSFDLFGERSHYAFSGLTTEQRANRELLRDVMTRCGFKPYDKEWWHFRLADEPYPDTYFTFPVAAASLAGPEA